MQVWIARAAFLRAWLVPMTLWPPNRSTSAINPGTRSRLDSIIAASLAERASNMQFPGRDQLV
jgi:hypothetical protein